MRVECDSAYTVAMLSIHKRSHSAEHKLMSSISMDEGDKNQMQSIEIYSVYRKDLNFRTTARVFKSNHIVNGQMLALGEQN